MKNYEIVPNPIYDNVFRYLLEDNESARVILSVLSGKDIIKLDTDTGSYTEKMTEFDKKVKIERLERKAELKKQKLKKSEWKLINTKLELQKIKLKDPHTSTDIARGHLDFIATVKNNLGVEELIMIELQKEKKPEDIYRFKRYIADKLTRQIKKTVINRRTKVPETKLISLPILPIFILNFKIEDDIKDLVLHTNNITTGLYTNKILEKPNDFIDNLTYGIIIVQLAHINQVKKKIDTFKSNSKLIDTYRLLSLFDQGLVYNNNPHRLCYDLNDVPKKFKRIVRRLKSAALENPDLEEQMYAEDEYLEALKYKSRLINNLKKELDSTTKELDKEKSIRLIAEEEKQKAEVEKQRAEDEKQKAEVEKQILKLFYIKRMSIEGISKKYKISIEEIEKILGMN